MGGIYFINCSANEKIYVGSAKDLSTRWSEHQALLRLQKHFNRNLQRAWLKYEKDAFTYSIHEQLGEYNKKFFFERENFWMDELRAQGKRLFNIARAEGGWGEETKLRVKEIGAKISSTLIAYYASLTDDERNKIYGSHHKDVPLPEQQKKHLSDFWKDKPKSESHKANMSVGQRENVSPETKKQRKINMSVVGKTRRGTTPSNAINIVFRDTVYTSVPECARKTGFTSSQIQKEIYGPNSRKTKKEKTKL